MSAPEQPAPVVEAPAPLKAAAAFIDAALNWVTRAVALVLGLAFVPAGGFVLLDSLGVLETEGSVFYAPRRVVGAAGLLFVVAGLYLITFATIGFKALKRLTRGWIIRVPILAGALAPLVMSGVLVLVALGRMEIEEVNAPPWVLLSAAGVFALMSVLFIGWGLTTRDPDVTGVPTPAPAPSTAPASLPLRIARSAFVVVLVALLSAMLTWAALYARPEDMSSSTTLKIFGVRFTTMEEGGDAGDQLGFAVVAVLGWLLTIVALVRGWRDVFGRARA